MRNIIIIGSGWSGSGAVFDYLAGRPDVSDPFKGEEFRLAGDPAGLFELQIKLKNCFSIQGADYAIKEFYKTCELLHRLPKLRGKKPLVDMEIVDEFINNIILYKYAGLAAYELQRKPVSYQIYVKLLRKLLSKREIKTQIGEMYFPVDEVSFKDYAKKFIEDIIKSRLDLPKQFNVINHGGTFWNPVTSTEFYNNRHIFIVKRDPRDIFVEIKVEGHAYPTSNVTVFCDWYKKMMNRINLSEWDSSIVSVLKFEEFVMQFDKNKTIIDNVLGLDNSIQSSLEIDRSKKNIGKYKNRLSKEETLVIESELHDFLHF